MKCPRCGEELLDGYMYCQSCGYEINLVPEFDSEVESSMAESMYDVIQEAIDEHNSKSDEDDIPVRKKSNFIIWLSGFGLAIAGFALAAVFFCGLTVWNNSTFLQEKIAEYYVKEENYDKAITYIEQNIKRVPENVAFRFALCDIYMKIGEADKALEIYKIVAGSSKSTFDEQLVAVEKIVAYHEENNNYQEIADYLDTIQDKNIQFAFYKYMCSTVSFSQPEGTYSSLITLKLDTEGLGTIHYTTDGTIPDQNSPEFTSTIFLEAGNNSISAVFINDYGIASEVITKNYFIESKKVSPPEVGTYSGNYSYPIRINVTAAYGTQVYYTTDGSSPNAYSKLYSGNLYAPIGKSIYKFVAIDEKGEVSEVITRDYQLDLYTDMTVDEAKTILVNHFALLNGKEISGSGHIIYDENTIYIYEYLYPMPLDGGTDCYYFAEVSRDVNTMSQHRTGRYYGVDLRTREIYDLTQ